MILKEGDSCPKELIEYCKQITGFGCTHYHASCDYGFHKVCRHCRILNEEKFPIDLQSFMKKIVAKLL